MSYGTTASYSYVPRIRNLVTNKIINPVAGANPADAGPVALPNVRGQVQFTIISGDNSYVSVFGVTGGFGAWPADQTQNWYPDPFSAQGCTVVAIMLNTIQVTTPVADAGGRTYILQFRPVQSVAPTVRQTSVNIIGNNTLTVRMVKQNIIEGH